MNQGANSLGFANRLSQAIPQTDRQTDRRGIPIGNLTSQIFANIYLNEFDRFVRHTLKPQAYLRYGDDFIIIASTRQQARGIRKEVQNFLLGQLKLSLHSRNDVIVPVVSGLHFLGHVITASYVIVDRYTTRSALARTSTRSIASYRSLHLAAIPQKELSWLLMDELTERGVL